MEPTLDLLERLIAGCGEELLIRSEAIDWGRRSTWGDLDFEGRLRAIRSASEFAHVAATSNLATP